MPFLPLAVKHRQHQFAVALVAAAAVFFFYSGPDRLALPTLRYLWNFGHILFFFAAVTLYLLRFPVQSNRQVIKLFAAVLSISVAIELIQGQIGRSLSLWDIGRNLVGTCAALLLFYRKTISWLAAAILLPLLLTDCIRLARTLSGDVAVAHLAPVIENFESQSTLRRWYGPLTQVTAPVLRGHYSARFELSTKKQYPSAILLFPHRDWSSYQSFHALVFNPGNQVINLSLRINDESHELNPNQPYQDRFNKTMPLTPGWNHLQIPLAEIRHAPQHREMDLSRIVKLVWFTVGLDRPRTLFLDDIWLE